MEHVSIEGVVIRDVLHGRARLTRYSVPSVTTLTRTDPICRVSRPARADQRLPTAAKADAEVKAKGASAGRGGIPGPTGNSAKSRGPATGAFNLRRGRKKPSAVAAIRPPAGTVKSTPPWQGMTGRIHEGTEASCRATLTGSPCYGAVCTRACSGRGPKPQALGESEGKARERNNRAPRSEPGVTERYKGITERRRGARRTKPVTDR